MFLRREASAQSSLDRRVRSSGRYALVRGEWFDEVVRSGVTETKRLLATPAQVGACPWVADLAGDGGAFEVPCDELERSVRVKSLCTYLGGGPFEISGLQDAEGAWVRGAVPADSPGHTALIYYDGEDRAWAEQQEGLEAYDVYSAMGYCVQGWVPLSELSDYREIVEERPIPGRS